MDIPKILTELGIDYKRAGESPHVTVNWVGIVCPWCGTGTGKYGLGIHRSGACKCWKDGSHSLVEALVLASGKPWQEVRKLLGEYGDHEPPAEIKTKGKLILPEGIGGLLGAHRDYVRSREFNPKTLRLLWGVGGIGIAAKYSWTLFIPVTVGGQTVSWTTRVLHDFGQRYFNAPKECEAMSAKSVLYGADHARHGVIVVEGPTDVWRVGPGAVATMSLTFTQAQVARLAKFPVRCICYDNEAQAQRRAAKLAEALSVYPGRTVRVEIDAADPGSASAKEVSRLRKEFLE